MTGSRVVLIAGASSGIGQAAATVLADRGHTVFGTSRDPARVKAPGGAPGRAGVE
ncbi:MAG: SDR family NAD(P)-dependent oxidoreductase [Stackebrandtia sp.]